MSHSPGEPADPQRHTNRLAKETSPYLLQHQHNPVDWHPWGAEAFERARREDKPIFLSVGYSTCYWCHVMERQSFENDDVAAVMNAKFVNIKVDREERPDVDQLYMTAVQVLARQGGWPMSVWLTPDLRPFYGGTYYPPTDQHGRPGFVTLLHALEDAYRSRRAEVDQTADQIVNILRRVAEPTPPERPITLDEAFVTDLVERSTADYDPAHGGFGAAPKFPRETLLELLLVFLREPQSAIRNPQSQIRHRLLHTLDALAAGGIRDHLGGGFHRYSTDAQWLVPHFEIMLYDNAMLAWCYVEAFRQTGEARYANVARGVLDFVLREMTSPDGAFYTAIDAEVDGQEGLNYLWIAEEVESILGPDDAAFFARVYGLDSGPNFSDPHHGTGMPDKNILHLPEPIETVAKEFGASADALDARLEPMRRKLKSARDLRKQPLLDTKILTSWNALMIRALAHAGRVLGRANYLEAAKRSAEFLLTRHRTSDGGLYRTSREGRAKYDGFLDDYAYLAHAMLALDEAGAQPQWRDRAAGLCRAMTERFGNEGAGGGVQDADAPGGFYFTDRRSSDLVVRQKTATDSPLPSGNAVAAMTLLGLGQVDAARATIAAFAQQVRHNGEGMSAMVQAALFYLRCGGEAFVVLPQAARPKDVERPLSPQQQGQRAVRVEGDWASSTELHVRLEMLPEFHVNAHDPGAPGSGVTLVPTRLTIDGPPRAVVIEYPPGDAMPLPFAAEPVRVYRGVATITLRFAQPVTSELGLRLTYQACNETACLPPVTRRVDVPAP